MNTSHRWSENEARVLQELRTTVSCVRTFERDDLGIFVLLSQAERNEVVTELFEAETPETVNSGYYTGLATATDVDTAGVHAMYVRIAAEGRIAFDSVLTVEELHSNIAAWVRGGSAFEGAMPVEHGLGMGRNNTYVVIVP